VPQSATTHERGAADDAIAVMLADDALARVTAELAVSLSSMLLVEHAVLVH
jgi:hypothetical protein